MYVQFNLHEVKIKMKDIIEMASFLLTDGGSFYMVQKTERLIESIDELRQYRLFPKRIRYIYPKCNKESYIFLIEAVKNGSSHGLKIEEPLYIYNDKNEYSREVLEYFHYGEKNA